jgi:hypothetical protein
MRLGTETEIERFANGINAELTLPDLPSFG